MTDIYALGVTLFRAFTGDYPYGNPDAVSPPRRERPKCSRALRPDLPAWLQAAIGRAIAPIPATASPTWRNSPEMEPGARRRRRAAAAHVLPAQPAALLAGRRGLLALALLVSLLRR